MDDDNNPSTIISQLQLEQIQLSKNIIKDMEKKTSTENINMYSAIDLRVYRTLLYMRRTRVLQKILKDNYNAITTATVTDDSVHNSIKYIRRIHLAFMRIYNASKRDGEYQLNPKCANNDSVVIATIKLWLTDEHTCQTERFFHQQYHIMDDIMMSMNSLKGIYQEMYKNYIIYCDLSTDTEAQNVDTVKEKIHITELIAALRKLYLSIGHYLGKHQEILSKCQEIHTGCSQTSQKSFQMKDNIVITGKSADLIQYMKSIKEDIIKESCSCKK